MKEHAQTSVPLWPYTTLRAGGPAEHLLFCDDVETLADVAADSQRTGLPLTILGSGSNVLPSDEGVPGLVVINRTSQMSLEAGLLTADTGCSFQDVFLLAAQNSLSGLQFAVGIPGTLGGALASNAGAYRNEIGNKIKRVEVVIDGERSWQAKDVLELSYRDSILRNPPFSRVVVLRVELALDPGEPITIYEEAREWQRQRIGKQPPPASAGSFFKNVYSRELADSLPTLPEPQKVAGVVPSGYLIEAIGFKGARCGGAMLAHRHANFIVNSGGATAAEIRSLAEGAAEKVKEEFGVEIEEEVLYIGDWSRYRRLPIDLNEASS